MNKHSFREKMNYRFDNMMSKGTVALVGMLFGATAIVVVLAAIVLAIIDSAHASVGSNIWASIMHVIDAGTITGADTGDIRFIIVMSVTTLCGLFVTSILIGIITTGFEEKLNELKKGNSKVIESNHTVILGFDSNIYSLVSELVIANESQKEGCIVVLTNHDKEEVETAITENVGDLKNTKVICRTGAITDTFMLEKCSLETARSIIINEDDDFMTIKAILAMNNYLKEVSGENKKPHIVATMHEKSNYEAAKIVAEGNAEIILVQDSISRIIAQTCRQPGLSNVLIELFDYDGDELYFESFPELAGHSFGQVLNYFEKAVVFGYKRAGAIYLNPKADEILAAQDEVLLLVEDNGAAKPVIQEYKHGQEYEMLGNEEDAKMNILILGVNEKLEEIILELDQYHSEGSKITIANNELAEALYDIQNKIQHIRLEYVVCDINNRDALNELIKSNIDHVLILSDEIEDAERADAMTLLKLIHLRDIAHIEGNQYSITSEMRDTANQKLAKVAEANDLVVGYNIVNLILTQVSENRDLAVVFQEILTSEGSEIYIRKASNYVKLDTEMDFYAVTNILKERNQIAIGYKKQIGNDFDVITNPNKSDKIIFTEDDYIITLADD